MGLLGFHNNRRQFLTQSSFYMSLYGPLVFVSLENPDWYGQVWETEAQKLERFTRRSQEESRDGAEPGVSSPSLLRIPP